MLCMILLGSAQSSPLAQSMLSK